MVTIKKAHITLNRILGYFCRKGNIEGTEKVISKIFLTNAKTNNNQKWIPGLNVFSKITSHIYLKKIISRRRKNKSVIYKIKPRNGRDNIQKIYINFVPFVTKSTKGAKYFAPRIEKELKNRQKTILKRSPDLAKYEPMFSEKRDFIHKIAKKVRPKSWKKKVKKTKKQTTKLYINRFIFKKRYRLWKIIFKIKN